MNITLKIRGSQDSDTLRQLGGESGITVERHSKILLGAARGDGSAVEIANVSPDDPLCLHFADGLELWMRTTEAYRDFGVGAARGKAQEGDVWELAPEKFAADSERGAAGMAVQALELAGVDLHGMAASAVAGWFEKKQLEGREGVYRLDLLAANPSLTPQSETLPADGKPYLVFLHGTASSCAGSYGKLWDGDNREGATARADLAQEYAERVYALEHRSLTASPIDNALDLVKLLPVGAELHLVSHSRGGLVGELLCLGQRGGVALTPELLDKLYREDRTQAEQMGFGKRNPDMAAAYAEQRGKLGELLAALDAKKIRVGRFVRVACPAMGTTLASGKLDRWLSLLKFAGGEGIVGDILDFLLAVVKERTDPRTLPGLEAMMPGSALVRLLNLPGLNADADLAVIAGDIEGGSTWGRIKLLLTDWFYDGEHDLVVNTGSMYGGIRRGKERARRYFTQGAQVCHFNYFRNPDTVKLTVSGLLSPAGSLGGYLPLTEAERKAPARGAPRQYAGPHPVAFVLPGIMGSTLAVQKDEIWLDFLDICQGGMERLKIDSTEEIRPQAPIARFYDEFIDYLGRSHEVVAFPYDWRLSVTESAALLKDALLKKLPEAEANRQPIRIVAHSMGGLVARAMLALYPDIWNRLKKLEGFRLMMLGTPNFGSYQAVRLMVGQYRIANQLAMLDFSHGRDVLLDIFNHFPGAAELLPWGAGDRRDFAAPALWAELRRDAGESWPLPDSAALAKAQATWKLLKQAPADGDCMVYVAGCAEQTACDYRVVSSDNLFLGEIPQIEFYSTARGDGTVPWDLGRLEGVKTWYVADTAHDQLLACPPVFPAYLELLQSGKTARLPDSEPLSARGIRGAEERRAMPPDLARGFPAEDELGGFGSGGARLPGATPQRRLPNVGVTITHGNLAYAGNPVCVGHYLGDTVVSAEKRLDEELGHALSNRQRMGIYPGRLGTWEIFIHRDRQAKPGGALVIGLGQVGELTPGGLETAISRALRDYALQVMQWHDERFGASNCVRSANVSFLLIGTGAGGITVRDSVEAILRGVKRANEKLVESRLDDRVLIDKIELLELYQDIAIQAARALEDVLADGSLTSHFSWAPRDIQCTGGQRRILCEDAPNWWQRLEIVRDKQRDELRFIALTNRARAEETLVAGELRLADDFIRQSISTTRNSREISRTLYEMLIPNRLKEFAPDRLDLVLVVDEDSAAYPWELLEDRWTDSGEPPATAAGMVRQFKTDSFRHHPAHTDADTALVVGNPKQSTFGNLPGARSEAESVVRVLAAGGFRVKQEIETGANSIMIGLHAYAYRILHLAGHGVREETRTTPGPCASCHQAIPGEAKTVCGMVIGDDTFLTPGDVTQMRWVPELVFINCCYLGNTQRSSESVEKYNRLAANLASQFIEMGVKAIIAAGWAVDDAAAKTFAEHFYQRMLADEPFGRAVQGARKTIFDLYPGLNTWGAYQCYGDPDYRLYNKGESTAKAPPAPFYTSAELVVALDNAASAACMGDGDAGAVERILKRIPEPQKAGWLAKADVLAALGVAYSETGRLDKALECLNLAVGKDAANFPLRVLEKRANFKARRAVELLRQDRSAATREQAGELLDQAFAELNALLGFGATQERYNLLASASKRKALAAANAAERKAALKMVRDYYEKSELVSTQTGGSREQHSPYPTINKWLAEILLTPKTLKAEVRAQLLAECRWQAEGAEADDRLAPCFWNATAIAESLLAQALAQGQLAERQDEILGIYRNAMARGASPREFASILDQYDFLEISLPDSCARAQAGALRNLGMEIRRMAGQ